MSGNYSSEESFNATETNVVSGALQAFLFLYYTPVIIGIGCIGNLLSVIVLLNQKLRRLSSSFYLAALSISDTFFLFSVLAQWLTFFDINLYNENYFCQFFLYLSGLCNFLSVWITVAFTAKRFIAVLYPSKRHIMGTVQRAKLILVGIATIGLLLNVPFFTCTAPQYIKHYEAYVCSVKTEFKVSLPLTYCIT